MAIFSKPVKITHTCYEIGHCWTPYCTTASTDVAKGVFVEALKIYGTLYLVAGILRKRGLKYYRDKFIPETLRSSIFLSINGAMFIGMFCVWRNLAGFYFLYNVLLVAPPVCGVAILFEDKKRNLLGGVYFLSTSFVPAYIGSFTALLFERKPRRGPLAVYLTNLAIETGFRMMVERKWVTPIPHGEVYLFSAVSAIYLYLFRKPSGLSTSAESLFRFFVGSAENPKRALGDAPKPLPPGASDGQEEKGQSRDRNTSTPSNQVADEAASGSKNGSRNGGKSSTKEPSSSSAATSLSPSSTSKSSSSSSSSSSSPSILQGLQNFVEGLPVIGQCAKSLQRQLAGLLKVVEGWPQHRCCQHNHSCVAYVLKGGSRMFAFGYVVQAAISTLSQITAIWKRPAVLKTILAGRANVKLAAFLGCYSAIFRSVNCLLRWIRNKDSEIHGFIAGGLAGLSLGFFKSVTIALYAATKLAEILYFKGIETHGLPYIKCADVFIYAFSTAFIFHAAVMEPHTLRPGYWKFLKRVTHEKFAYMNRRLLDPFGVNSSKIAPDHWPDYDPAFTSLFRPKSS